MVVGDDDHDDIDDDPGGGEGGDVAIQSWGRWVLLVIKSTAPGALDTWRPASQDDDDDDIRPWHLRAVHAVHRKVSHCNVDQYHDL